MDSKEPYRALHVCGIEPEAFGRGSEPTLSRLNTKSGYEAASGHDRARRRQ